MCSCSITWCRTGGVAFARSQPRLLRAALLTRQLLSPAIHAALLARAGRPDQALEPFRLAANIDRADLTGTTAGGVHLATMGGLWQGVGIRLRRSATSGSVLEIDPQLPGVWDALALRLHFRGSRVRVRLEHERVTVESDHELPTSVEARRPPTARTIWTRDETQWKVRKQ